MAPYLHSSRLWSTALVLGRSAGLNPWPSQRPAFGVLLRVTKHEKTWYLQIVLVCAVPGLQVHEQNSWPWLHVGSSRFSTCKYFHGKGSTNVVVTLNVTHSFSLRNNCYCLLPLWLRSIGMIIFWSLLRPSSSNSSYKVQIVAWTVHNQSQSVHSNPCPSLPPLQLVLPWPLFCNQSIPGLRT